MTPALKITEPDREQIIPAVMRVTCEEQARLFTLQVQLAAELHPDEIRAALAAVFDLSLVEKRIREIHAAAVKLDGLVRLLERRIAELTAHRTGQNARHDTPRKG